MINLSLNMYDEMKSMHDNWTNDSGSPPTESWVKDKAMKHSRQHKNMNWNWKQKKMKRYFESSHENGNLLRLLHFNKEIKTNPWKFDK